MTLTKSIVTLLSTAFILAQGSALAQTARLGKLEVDFGVGMLYTDKMEYLSDYYYSAEYGEYITQEQYVPVPAGARLYGELRYNIGGDVDLAAQLVYASFGRDNDDGRYRTYTTAAIIDYNWRTGRGVDFFAGAGAGFTKQYYSYAGVSGVSSSGAIRSGMEFFDRVRLTIEGRFDRWGYSHTGISIGYVIGGRVPARGDY